MASQVTCSSSNPLKDLVAISINEALIATESDPQEVFDAWQSELSITDSQRKFVMAALHDVTFKSGPKGFKVELETSYKVWETVSSNPKQLRRVFKLYLQIPADKKNAFRAHVTDLIRKAASDADAQRRITNCHERMRFALLIKHPAMQGLVTAAFSIMSRQTLDASTSVDSSVRSEVRPYGMIAQHYNTPDSDDWRFQNPVCEYVDNIKQNTPKRGDSLCSDYTKLHAELGRYDPGSSRDGFMERDEKWAEDMMKDWRREVGNCCVGFFRSGQQEGADLPNLWVCHDVMRLPLCQLMCQS